MYLNNLRAVLADLYPDVNDARRLADDAELSSAAIDFNGTAQNIWQSVLQEAIKRGAIDDLLQIAIDEYTTNAELLLAAWSYKRDVLHMEMVATGEGVGVNGNGQASLYRRIDALESKYSELHTKVALLDAQLVSIQRHAASGVTTVDRNTLLFALLFGVIIFTLLWFNAM